MQHSTEFPTRCTLTVDGQATSGQHQQSQSPGTSQYDWRLPSSKAHNDQLDFQRLHTVDVYFWTLDDANQFLDTIGHVLSSSQLETDRVSAAPQSDQPISMVVQQLENVAVSDPAYQNGQTRNSQSNPAPPAAVTSQAASQPSSFPPPPGNGQPTDENHSCGHQAPAEENKKPADFAPIPYNPAAPAAPEPISHREKTPPPEDGTEGTGLAGAAAEKGTPYTHPQQVSGGVAGGFAPPPSSQGLAYSNPGAMATGYASPPPSAGLTHSATFPTQSSMQSPGLPPYQQSFYPGHGGQQWSAAAPGMMPFVPPSQEPNAHLYSQQFYGLPQSHPHHTGPPAPFGGYSNYSYAQTQAPQPPGSEYDIHSQVYRPTQAEANSPFQKHAQNAMKNLGQRPRTLEENASRVDSGVNRFLKKLEKKIG